MAEILVSCLLGFIPPLAWWCGYHYGKVDGIREVRHLMDEQRKDYESFRDIVFRELGVGDKLMGSLSEEVRTEVLCGRICDLESENAKLRELCANMLSEDMDQHWPEFTRRAKELGVEVDA